MSTVNNSLSASLYTAGSTGVQWLSQNTKNLAAGASASAKAVASGTLTVFKTLGKMFLQVLSSAAGALSAMKNQIAALPRDAKLAGGALVLAAFAFKLGQKYHGCSSAARAPAQDAAQVDLNDANDDANALLAGGGGGGEAQQQVQA